MITNKLVLFLKLFAWCIRNWRAFLTPTTNEPLTIVTASDSSHQKSLRNLILSLDKFEPDSKVIVFDLGMHKQYVAEIREEFPGLDIRRFPYERFPPHYNIKIEAGCYAWKPAAMELAKPWKGLMLWFDAGNLVTGKLTFLRKVLSIHSFYSPNSVGTLKEWTHPSVLKSLGIYGPEENLRNVAANVIAFNSLDIKAVNLIEKWIQLSKSKEMIAPAGSSRMNHRQDQSLLSILAHQSGLIKYGNLADFPRRIFKILVHQDAD